MDSVIVCGHGLEQHVNNLRDAIEGTECVRLRRRLDKRIML